jgi:hypothetical protein
VSPTGPLVAWDRDTTPKVGVRINALGLSATQRLEGDSRRASLRARAYFSLKVVGREVRLFPWLGHEVV